MSDYVERLERELLSKGSRFHGQHHATAAGGRRRVSWSLLFALSATTAVVAVVLVAALHAGHHSGPATPPAGHSAATGLGGRGPRGVGPCRYRTVGRRRDVAPRTIFTAAAPPAELLSELAVLRRPAAAAEGDRLDRQTFDSFPEDAIRVFTRFVRSVPGPARDRIVLIPAVVCWVPTRLPEKGPNVASPRTALLMQLLGPDFRTSRPPTIFAGTVAQIGGTAVTPGLDADDRAWFQTVVVPDGVSRVQMRFTPPFRPHYIRTVTIRDNVGAVFPLPGSFPTTTIWYGRDGHVLRSFVDRTALRYDRCLAARRRRCT